MAWDWWNIPDNPDIGGGGGGGGGGGNNDAEAKKNKLADRLEDITRHSNTDLDWKYNQGRDVYDISDQQARRLWEAQTEQNQMKGGDDWFKQQKKLQSSMNQIKGSAGSSLTGSNLLNMLDLFKSADDDIDTEVLNTMRDNQNTINNDLFETLSQNVNARNELAADTEYAKKQLRSDLAAQIANLDLDSFDSRMGNWWTNGDGFYDSHKTGPAEITKQGFYREDNAGKNAQQINQQSNQSPTASSAANSDYWNRLFQGYGNRY